MAARPADYLDGLNEAQREAVETLDGPVLMLAGAGTGKTKALTSRVAHLLHSGRARPDEVLAVTFTNKAAKEMKDRVAAHVGGAEGLRWMGTFHAICVKLLRRHAELVGLESNFTILDTDDQLRLLKQLIALENIDEKRWPARLLAGIIDGWKNRAWGPENLPASESEQYNGRGPALYKAYQARLKSLNAVDFGDLLLHVVTIFQQNHDILERYQRWFRYILVDEYQDTNVAQYLWLRLLASGHRNICCVGDDDQSIYGWRGAEVGNILRFEQDFPGAKVIRLEQNYRSTRHILGAASGVIRGNEGRLGKELWTAKEGGGKVRLIGHWDGEEEARWVGEEIEAMQGGTRGQAPRSLEEMAILVRASHQMRAFEDRFLTIGLPYRVIGGPRFYERMEIRDAMAYFRVAQSPTDDLAFERIVNTPRRGLGDKAIQSMARAAREFSVPLMQGAAIALERGDIKGRGVKSLDLLLTQFARWHGKILAGEPHVELAETILEEAGYTEMWLNDKSPEAPGRLENLKELIKALEEFENLQGFLEHVSLIMENDADAEEEKVTIMTLHGAKGLEFPVVFLPGWEDGLFPSQRSMDENGVKGLEEERRLAYVGITRAEEICTISFATNRRVYGQWQNQMPSRFIDELPTEHVEVLTAPGLSGGGMGRYETSDSAAMQRAARADAYNSPGWKRMQARQERRAAAKTHGTSIEGLVQPASEYFADRLAQPGDAPGITIDATALSVLDRVHHAKFGAGTVLRVDGEKVEVAFDTVGEKKIVARFLTRIAEKAPEDDVPF
ncbi:MAG: DNA helicase II [Rhodobacterales bacterium]|nr:MAG: DNA helicase II [Rhodobacterales bacterium]